MKNKIVDIIFLTILLVIAWAGFLRPIIAPKVINYNENRNAYQLPDIRLNTFFDKSFQNAFELAYADQIPLASRMKTAKNIFAIATTDKYLNLFDNHTYHNLGNSIYKIEDYLVFTPTKFKNVKPAIDAKIANINKTVQIADADVYLYYIDRDLDIDFNTNTNNGLYTYLANRLDSKIKVDRLEINNFEDYKEYYYKTDHHWNHKGVNQAYNDLIKLLIDEKEISLKPNKEICLNSILDGSKSRTLGGTKYFNEQFCTYTYNLPNHFTYVNGISVENHGQYKQLLENPSKQTTYGDWFGYDAGMLEYNYHNTKADNLLIIGDSFDNAINEVLASHFNKTYVVDLRHFKNDIGQTFNIINFIKGNNIDKVLFLGSSSFIEMNAFMIGGI